VSKTFSLPAHTNVDVSLTIYALDNWDGSESIMVYVDDNLEATLNPDNTDPNNSNLCGDPNFLDSIHQINFTLLHNNDTLTLTIMQSSPDPSRSFGIRDVILTTRNCNEGCTDCSGPSSTDCFSCKPDTISFNGECLYECYPGFYKDLENQTCSPCSLPCGNCTGPGPTDCLTCNQTDTFIHSVNQTCLEDCPIGFFKNIANKSCDPCLESCSTCENAYECIDCSPTYPIFFSQNNSCLQECPVYFFENELSGCDPCDASCMTCNGSTALNCTSCEITYLHQGQCVPNCESGFWKRESDHTCQACDPTCRECEEAADNCLNCVITGEYPWFYNNSCYSSCPEKTYPDNSTYMCLPCDEICHTCWDSGPENCLSCNSTLFLGNDTCHPECPEGFHPNITSRVCEACSDSYCRTCPTNSSFCEGCYGGYDLWALDGVCGDYCTPGTYPDNTTFACEPCDDTCETCWDGNPDNCITCPEGRFFYENECLLQCPDHFYGNSTLRECIPCDDPDCQSCLAGTDICNKCVPNNGKWLNGTICDVACPEIGKYPNNITFVCADCDPTCHTCSDEGIYRCTSCTFPRYFYDNRCMEACNDGYFPDMTLHECVPCDDFEYCQKCPDATNLCSKCWPNKGHFLYENACTPDCPIIGFFPNTDNFQCDPCHDTCLSCSGALETNCLACNSSLFLYDGNNTCLPSCPDKFHPNVTARTCDPCLDVNCKTCDSEPGICDACMPSIGQYLFNSVCIPECPLGFYKNDSVWECSICDSTCEGCFEEADHCTSCNETRYLNIPISKCVEICPNGTWENPDNHTCDPCVVNCLTCEDGTNRNCSVCNNAENYWLDFNSSCWLQICGDGRKLGPPEECDDGNNEDGDGCSADCKIERGWYCHEPNITNLTSFCYTICGDGMRVDKTEECDDFNDEDGDGCSKDTCVVEPGYYCYGGSLWGPDTCTCEPRLGEVVFSPNWEGISVRYNNPLTVVNTSIPMDSPELCRELFNESSYEKFGINYTCNILGSEIVVNFGYMHSYNIDTQTRMIPNTYYRLDCPQKHLNQLETFYSEVLPGDYSLVPEYTISAAAYIPCKRINVSIEATNVGKREFTTHWRLVGMNEPFTQSVFNDVKNFIATVSPTQEFYIVIPPLLMLPPNTYTLEATVIPFWNETNRVKTIGIVSKIKYVIRNPDFIKVCSPPSTITIHTYIERKDIIDITFNRVVVNTVEELKNAIHLEILDYDPDDFNFAMRKMNVFTFRIQLLLKKSIYNKELQLTVLNSSLILDKYLNAYIGPLTFTKALYDYDVYSKSQIQLTKQASRAAAASLITTIIPIVVFGSGPLIMSFLDGAQLLNFLRYINVYYPINVDAFLQSFDNINFKFLPNFFESFWKFVDVVIPVEGQEAPLRFKELKMTCLYFYNAGSIFALLVGILLGHLLCKFLSKLPNKKSRIVKFAMKMRGFMVYNGYLAFFDSTLYQQGIAIFLQFRKISFFNLWNKTGFIFAAIHSIIFFGFPVFCYFKTSRLYRISFTENSKFLYHFGFLVEELDTSRRYARMFFIVILLRKMIYTGLLVFLHDWFYYEIFSMIALNLLYIAALIIVRPFTTIVRWKKEVLSEFLLMLTHTSILFIKLYEDDSNKKYTIGWITMAGSMGIISIYLYQGVIMIWSQTKTLILNFSKRSMKRLRSLKWSPTPEPEPELVKEKKLHRLTSLKLTKRRYTKK